MIHSRAPRAQATTEGALPAAQRRGRNMGGEPPRGYVARLCQHPPSRKAGSPETQIRKPIVSALPSPVLCSTASQRRPPPPIRRQTVSAALSIDYAHKSWLMLAPAPASSTPFVLARCPVRSDPLLAAQGCRVRHRDGHPHQDRSAERPPYQTGFALPAGHIDKLAT